MSKLDHEERELLEAFETGELKQAPHAENIQSSIRIRSVIPASKSMSLKLRGTPTSYPS